MKTIGKNSAIATLITSYLLIQSTQLKASERWDSFTKNMSNYFAKDGLSSFYIIGGIAIFGVIIFVVNSIVKRRERENELKGKSNTTIRPLSHHRHHRAIKKTA